LDPTEIEASRNKYLWKQLSSLDILHSELASLYRMVPQDKRRIALVWRAIEEKEALLVLDGVDING
jgi:hypothetical protein